MAHFKDLVLKKQDTNGKEYADEFFKQRITIVLLLVVGVYIYSSINEFYFFEKDYYEYLLNTFAGITLLTGIAYLCYPKKKANLKMNWY